MGIILNKSKPAFDELKSTNSFGEFFMNGLRDYYTYGFKSYDQYLKGQRIINERWKIFSKILGSEWVLEERSGGRNFIILKAKPVGTQNPFSIFYFLHNISTIGDYLNYLLDLDERSSLRGGLVNIPVDLKRLDFVEGKNGIQNLEDVNNVEYSIIENWKHSLAVETYKQICNGILPPGYLIVIDKEKIQEGNSPNNKSITVNKKDNIIDMIFVVNGYKYYTTIDSGKEIDNENFRIRINRQMNIWSYRTMEPPKSYKDIYANLSTRTDYLYGLGVLGDLRDFTEKRNTWIIDQCKNADSTFKKYIYNKKSGNNYWFKSKLTMQEIFKDLLCNSADSENNNLVNSFVSLCNFFSHYYPMGTIGSLLSTRCKNISNDTYYDMFKFKHNYLQQTLYDFNLIDLLYAIEHLSVLCVIQYSHGIKLNTYEDIAIPIEIRISAVDGREYVLYYHIIEKKIKAMRLEFINSIKMYSEVKSIKKVRRLIKRDGNKKRVEEEILENVTIDAKDIAHQIITAREMLPYIWGTGVENCAVSDDWENLLASYEMEIQYNPEEELYISNRIKKENRNRELSNIRIFPTKELRRWVRSYYKRIGKYISPGDLDFNIDDDVESICDVYFSRKAPYGEVDTDYIQNKEKEYEEEGYIVKGKIVKEYVGHAALFNTLFSNYTVVLVNSILECSKKDNKLLGDVLEKNVIQTFNYFNECEIKKIVDELSNIIKDSELINFNGESRFLFPESDYLFDVLPLTKIEARWLLTILNNPLASLFMTESDIKRLKEKIKLAPYKVKPLDFNCINYFDRYNFEHKDLKGKKTVNQDGRISNKDLKVLKIIKKGISEGFKLKIKYRNWRKQPIWITCAPCWIEYSIRDDLFRLWYVRNGKSGICIINIPRIEKVIELTNMKYDIKEQSMLLESIYKESMQEIQVEFFQGDRNILDRILTEFSLWEKKCVFDSVSKYYRMTLYYSKMDESEIMMRLLSYGPFIRVVADDDNYVLSEVRNRIVKQYKLNQIRKLESEKNDKSIISR